MLVDPVEQWVEIEVDHKRYNMKLDVRDSLLLENTTHFSADLLAHITERRQYNSAIEQLQTSLILRRKLVDLVA
jgi:hypothetical protein